MNRGNRETEIEKAFFLNQFLFFVSDPFISIYLLISLFIIESDQSGLLLFLCS